MLGRSEQDPRPQAGRPVPVQLGTGPQEQSAGDRAAGDRAAGDRAAGDWSAGDRASAGQAGADQASADQPGGERADGNSARVLGHRAAALVWVVLAAAGAALAVVVLQVHRILLDDDFSLFTGAVRPSDPGLHARIAALSRFIAPDRTLLLALVGLLATAWLAGTGGVQRSARRTAAALAGGTALVAACLALTYAYAVVAPPPVGETLFLNDDALVQLGGPLVTLAGVAALAALLVRLLLWPVLRAEPVRRDPVPAVDGDGDEHGAATSPASPVSPQAASPGGAAHPVPHSMPQPHPPSATDARAARGSEPGRRAEPHDDPHAPFRRPPA